ncbi:hypothetical protein PVAP13_3NG140915 [Panicum virgatum]|uniref:Uncharacterized protein n=1 Tax=Panicum virgatum TaxID=38727 RepID=A0A8T0UEG1_PANVG|nr:hypothetical protein PVAP13_3NG140915 [Panicum virgatum]
MVEHRRAQAARTRCAPPSSCGPSPTAGRRLPSPTRRTRPHPEPKPQDEQARGQGPNQHLHPLPPLALRRAVGGFGVLNVYQRPSIPVPYPSLAGDFTLLVGDRYKAGHRQLRKSLDASAALPSPDGLLDKQQRCPVAAGVRRRHRWDVPVPRVQRGAQGLILAWRGPTRRALPLRRHPDVEDTGEWCLRARRRPLADGGGVR